MGKNYIMRSHLIFFSFCASTFGVCLNSFLIVMLSGFMDAIASLDLQVYEFASLLV